MWYIFYEWQDIENVILLNHRECGGKLTVALGPTRI